MNKYSKMLLTSAFCLTSIFASKEVNAQTNSYYTNDNGVSFTQEEYNFFTKMYWDGYQKTMTQSDFDEFVAMDFLNAEFASKTITDPGNATRGTEHTTSGKSLKISKMCSSNCRISVVLTWFGVPNCKGHDVMGAFMGGVSLQSTPFTRISTTATTRVPLDIKQQSKGFGTSMLLPDDGYAPIINQDYYVSTGGKVYASYQHAMAPLDLAQSQDFDVNGVGYGRVFTFYNEAHKTYDAMPGVDIEV